MRSWRDRKRAQFAPLLRGRGLEIGAFNQPFPFGPDADVLYADVWTPDDVARMAPGAKRPDIMSDSESFPTIADGSLDFVVANHVLEHLTDPIRALIEWHRVLRDGGLLLMALPDKRYTFDRPRTRTTLDHLLADHASTAPPRDRNYVHFVEWATHVERLQPGSPEFNAWISNAYERGGTVHNHVWVAVDILRVLRWMARAGEASWSVERFLNTSPLTNEFVLLLRRSVRANVPILRAYAGEPMQIAMAALKRGLQNVSAIRRAINS